MNGFRNQNIYCAAIKAVKHEKNWKDSEVIEKS